MHHIVKIKRDIGVGIFFLILCGVILLITLKFEKVPPVVAQGMQPEDFPQIIISTIVVLAVILILQAKKDDSKQQALPLMLLWTSGLLITFVILLNWAGTLISMFLFCIALPLLWGERRYIFLSVYALCYPSLIYFVFFYLLKVRLPSGFLEQLLG